MAEVKGNIFEIQKMSTEDGPGIRTTVFFKQCPLRCVWCHNPESLEKKPTIIWYETKCIGCESCIEVCPENALSMDQNGIHINRELCQACGKCVDECPATALRQMGKIWTIDDLMDTVAKDRAYYVKSKGGITASGGAAAVQTEFVKEFLKRCKEEGFHTALDICGILPKSKYVPLLPYIDLYLYDLKEIDPIKHQKFTGLSNDVILQNLKWLVGKIPTLNTNAKIWIRTPIIPGYTDSEENVKGIGNFIVNELENQIERWDLLSFNNLAKDKYRRMDLEWELADAELLEKEKMEYFVEIARKIGVENVKWSGLTKTNSNVEENQDKKEYKNLCNSRIPNNC